MAAVVAAAGAPLLPRNDSSVCWICLEGGSLTKPCKCACMRAHKQCLAAWQLAKSGTRDEVQCRFCLSALPAWKPVLRDSLDKVDPSSALPVVAVVYGGQEYRLTVQATPEGLRRFGKQVEIITGQPFSDEMDVRFFCKSPTGYNLQLQGVQSLEAAMTCAAVTAAERGLQESTTPDEHESATVALGKGTQFCGVTTSHSYAAGYDTAQAGQDAAGGSSPAALMAADAAADDAGDGPSDATATILHVGPARQVPRIDIVEYWRRQQLQRLQAEATAAATATEAAATAGARGDVAPNSSEGPVGQSAYRDVRQPDHSSDRASCLPLRWSDMLRRLLPGW